MHSDAEILARAKTLHLAGQLAEAETLYRQLVSSAPDNVEAIYLLAAACDALGNQAEAETLLERVIRLAPEHAQAHNHLGAIRGEQDRLDEAIDHFELARRLKPEWADPQNNLRNALAARHNGRGLALAAQGKLDQAAAEYRAALGVSADDVSALINLGNLCKTQHKLADAIAWYTRAMAVAPQLPAAHFNLGLVFSEQSRSAEAEASFRKAVELKPDYTEARLAVGKLLVQGGQPQEAVRWNRQTVEQAPNSADVHFSLAFALLLTGQLPEGWREYEWRLLRPGLEDPLPAETRWNGSALAGRTILLRCEQGYGDALQFIRYASLLKQQGGTVIVECRQPLARLLATCPGVDRVVVRGEARPHFDVHVPLLSLPSIFVTTLETIPDQVPYLHADAALVAHWKHEMVASAGLKIGIAWQGDPEYPNDRARSLRLQLFDEIGRMPGVRLYSLQMGAGREQLAEAVADWPVVDLGDRLGDFHDTAAILRSLDLVISSDSAPAHLAGALGVPVWVPTCFAPDWRWLLAREDSPWYPTMRLFRQARPGDWQSVFRRIAEALADLVRSK